MPFDANLPRYNRKPTPIKVTPIKTPTPPTPINNAVIPKINLPTYNGPTAHTSYPTIQKIEKPLTPTTDGNQTNLLKKYPQILLLIPLIIIILSKK